MISGGALYAVSPRAANAIARTYPLDLRGRRSADGHETAASGLTFNGGQSHDAKDQGGQDEERASHGDVLSGWDLRAHCWPIYSELLALDRRVLVYWIGVDF